MLRTLDGVTGVLAVLVLVAGVTCLAALRRPFRRVPAVVLAVAVGIATASATVAASARQSVDDAFAAMPADLVVRGTGPIDPATLDAIRAIRSVDLATSGATEHATVDGTRAIVSTWDDNGAANLLLARRATSGTIETLTTGQVLMSERVADRFGVRVGDRVTVRLPNRDARELRLVGVYADSPADAGIVLSWSDWATPRPTAMLVKLAPGTVAGDVARQIAGTPAVSVVTTDRAARDLDEPVDRLMLVTWTLLAVTMCLAGLGIARSIGPPAPIRAIARDSAAAAVFASAAGVAAGVVFGATVTWALGARGVTDLAVPWAQLATCIVASALLGALGAIRPAARRARASAPDPVSR